MASIDVDKCAQFVQQQWDESVMDTLKEYIAIPNQSPLFNPNWKADGLIDKAADLFLHWAQTHLPRGASVERIQLDGKTPVLFIDVPATHGRADDDDRTVLMYGHLDKQPPMTADWDEGLHPYKPVVRGDKLFGRGGADDGYALFSAVTALRALDEQNVGHARTVVLIEASEESGSKDLPAYVEHLKERMGAVDLVVCLDSGCGNYDQLWLTSSLRGIAVGTLRVDIGREGVHSGSASGVMPSSFRIVREVLDRVEDSKTGKLLDAAFAVDIPADRLEQTKKCAEVMGEEVHKEFPFVDGAKPMGTDLSELLLNRNWRAALSYTGVAGMPALQDAGNVLRPYTSLKLSLRLPPTLEPTVAINRLKELIEADPPYGARVSFDVDKSAQGWNAPSTPEWLDKAFTDSSRAFYDGKEAVYQGEGGSIPFMGMLGARFPKAVFMITGVLGPQSNAHGPNEFMQIPMSRKVTSCVAWILNEHAKQK